MNSAYLKLFFLSLATLGLIVWKMVQLSLAMDLLGLVSVVPVSVVLVAVVVVPVSVVLNPVSVVWVIDLLLLVSAVPDLGVVKSPLILLYRDFIKMASISWPG